MPASITVRRMLGEAEAYQGVYAFELAASQGQVANVRAQLRAGVDLHVHSDYALRWASGEGHSEVVKLLLAAGADVHALNDHALYWAANSGHAEVVKLLLAAGARWDLIEPERLPAIADSAAKRRAPWLRDVLRAMIPE